MAIGEIAKEAWQKEADEEYRLYRNIGMGVSATAIAIASGLLAWGIGREGRLAVCLQVTAAATILSAYLIQSFQFRGQQHRARRYYHKESNSRAADIWFRRADWALNATEAFLATSVLLGGWLKVSG